MLGFGRERGFDLMGIVRGFVLIIGFFFIGCVFDDGMLVLNGFKGDLYEWSKIKVILYVVLFLFLKKLNIIEIE